MRSQTQPRSIVLFATSVLIALIQATSIVSAAELIRSETGSKGLYQKLIVTKDKTEVEWHPDFRDRGEIGAYSIFWRLSTGTPGNKKDGKLLAGDNEGNPYFYINEDAVEIWDTRTAIDPLRPVKDTDPVMEVYKEREKQNVEAILTPEKTKLARTQKLYAIVTGKGFPEDEIDENYQTFPVTIFVGKSDREGGKKDVEDSIENLTAEIVFVCDTTMSMQPLIDTAKKLMQRVTSGISGKYRQAKGAVRFGIVEYRDEGKANQFISRVTLPLNDDPQKTLDALNGMVVLGGDDVPEAVTSGLETALDDAGWQKNSSKHIILLGDAPNKSDFGPTIESINKRLNGSGKTGLQEATRTTLVHTVQAYGGIVPLDAAATNHFESFSTATSRPGFITTVDTTNPAEKTARIEDFYEQIADLIETLTLATEGKLPESVPESDGKDNMSQSIWTIVNASGDTKNNMGVINGYASVTAKDGEVVGNTSLLVVRKDMRTLAANLNQVLALIKKIKKGGGDLKTFIDEMQTGLTKIFAGDPVTDETNLRDLIGDLPMKTDALNLTVVDIATMKPAGFDKWEITLKEAEKRAVELYDDVGPDGVWFDPNDLCETDEKITFMRKQDLP